MTAPARAGSGGVLPPRSRTRATTQQREHTAVKPAALTERSGTARARTAAAERAYARRAQRTQRAVGGRPERERRQGGSASRVSFVVGVISLLIAGVVATLWLSTQATADAYRLEQAKKDTNALTQRVQDLQRQDADAGSPPSLAAGAQRLGMVPAPEPAHIVVGPDGKVTVIGTPSKAEPPPPPAPSTPPPTGPPTGPTTGPTTRPGG